MYEKEITQIIETLNDHDRKEILDFAEFIIQKNKTEYKNKSGRKSLEELDGIFNEYANPKLIAVEKDLAWELAVKDKFQDKV